MTDPNRNRFDRRSGTSAPGAFTSPGTSAVPDHSDIVGFPNPFPDRLEGPAVMSKNVLPKVGEKWWMLSFPNPSSKVVVTITEYQPAQHEPALFRVQVLGQAKPNPIQFGMEWFLGRDYDDIRNQLMNVHINATNKLAQAEVEGENTGIDVEDVRRHQHQVHNSVLASLASGVDVIVRERWRQFDKGLSVLSDAAYVNNELARAAAIYALAIIGEQEMAETLRRKQPWPEGWFHIESDPIQNLAKVGALAAADVDRRINLLLNPKFVPLDDSNASTN